MKNKIALIAEYPVSKASLTDKVGQVFFVNIQIEILRPF